MMSTNIIQAEFQKAATIHNGEYKYSEKIIEGFGRTTPISYHHLTVPFNDNSIQIKYEFGNYNFGIVKCSIVNMNKKFVFDIRKTSNLKQFFSKDKSSLKVVTPNKEFKESIMQVLVSTGLEKLAKDSTFHPKVTFNTKGSITEIKTIYYLGFKNKEKSILAIIEFYKGVITAIKKS